MFNSTNAHRPGFSELDLSSVMARQDQQWSDISTMTTKEHKMSGIRNRIATGTIAGALFLGITFGFVGGPASPAAAEPNTGGSGGTVCKYDGKDYSPGASITVTDRWGNKHDQVCQSDGTWKTVSIVVPTPNPIRSVLNGAEFLDVQITPDPVPTRAPITGPTLRGLELQTR